jgi:hypothetical protein
MDAITTIEAARLSLAGLLGLARGAAAAAVDHQLKDRLIDIQQAILDAQSKLADAQAERLDLLDEVGTLRGRVRELEGARAELDAYELTEIASGVRLYKSKGGAVSQHYACPRCYSERKIGLMQSTSWARGQVRWLCASCSYVVLTGERSPREDRTRRITPSGYIGS